MDDIITIFQDYKQNIIHYKDAFPIIEQFKLLIGEQNLILQSDGSIQVKNYVGYFQKGKVKIQVLPKIYWGEKFEPDEIEKSLNFLFRLLVLSGYLTFNDLDDLDIKSIKRSSVEIFIRIFIHYFLDEFNKAPHYEYVREIENQQIIKGKILFTETIKENSYINHRHVVEFDEFSIDNKLNQIFKYIIQEALKSTEDGTNKMLLKQGLILLEDVSTLVISKDFFDSVVFNRQNQRYKSLFNFARLFFFNNQPGLSQGEERTFSFIIPLNLLFENSVKVFLMDLEKDRTTRRKLDYHNHIFFGKEDGVENRFNQFKLEPDFLLSKITLDNKKETIAVLDTKFKYPFNDQKQACIKDSDLYQMTTYASAYNCNLIFVIYPLFKNSPTKDTCIANFTLKTRFKLTKLILLQIDITEENIDKIKEGLKETIVSFLGV